jgi:DNA-binding CsgD family transcriptional regulator
MVPITTDGQIHDEATPSGKKPGLARKPIFSAPLLDMLPFGFVILNAKAKILFQNAFARELLDRKDGLHAEEGVLEIEPLAHRRLFSEALETLVSGSGSDVFAFSIGRPYRTPLSILVTRFTGVMRVREGSRGVKIALILGDPEANLPLNPAVMRDLYNFTPVECAIASLMLQSLDTASIARQLGIASDTLRGHLKRMFPKVHVRDQTDLVYALLRSPAGLRLPHPEEPAESLPSPHVG